MGDRSGIEWTEATWNPTTGCDRVSPGCGDATGGGCYAERLAARLQYTSAYAGTVVGGRWTGQVNLVPERLDVPLRWRKPRLVFVDSMSDLFHPDVPDAYIAEVFARMGLAEQHTFQVLTKRPQRMASLLSTEEFVLQWYAARHQRAVERDVQLAANRDEITLAMRWPLPNVWLGTSIESDRYTFRADHLRATPAAVRFLSLEPLLAPLPSLDLAGIDWVIVGGESGPRARPMELEWVLDIRDRCLAAGVAFFFKQWGGRTAKSGGRTLAGRTWDEMPSTGAARRTTEGGRATAGPKLAVLERSEA